MDGAVLVLVLVLVLRVVLVVLCCFGIRHARSLPAPSMGEVIVWSRGRCPR
jgi:hypothetical protein